MNQPSANLKSWFSCLHVHYQIKCGFLNLRSLATYSATELIAHFLFSHVNSFSSTVLTYSFRFVFFILFVCLQRNLSGEAEFGRHLTSQSWNQERCGGCTSSLGEWVNERERGMDGCQRRGEAEAKMGILKLSCYYFAHFLPEAFGLWTVLQS